MVNPLVSQNNNLGNVSAKHKIGGGFKTNRKTDIKILDGGYEDRVREKERQRRVKERDLLQMKIKQLEGFELGISEVDSEKAEMAESGEGKIEKGQKVVFKTDLSRIRLVDHNYTPVKVRGFCDFGIV